MHIAYIILIIIIVLLVAMPYGICFLAAWALKQWPLWAAGIKWTGIVISAVVALIFMIGFTWGWRQVKVTKYSFAHTSIPAVFDGYRIVQLSDFHIGTLSGHPEVVQHIVDSVNALHPDLIVFTGDLVNMHADEETEFHEILRGFKANDGVVSVMGNHDYMMYAHGHRGADNKGKLQTTKTQIADIQRLQNAERDLGWHLLLNDNYVIHRGFDAEGTTSLSLGAAGMDSIAIVGVENDGDGKHFPQYGDLRKAQHGLEEGTFRILLSHDPTHWRRRVLPDTNIPLTLSGHTHAMQFMMFGWSPSRWVYPEWKGEYTDDIVHEKDECSTGASRTKSTHRTLFVSSGIGEVGVPFRFGAWPEIVEITLRSK